MHSWKWTSEAWVKDKVAEEFAAAATLAANDEELADTATNDEEFAATTLAAHEEELADAATLATNDEEFAAATVLAATKHYVSVELAEKDHIVKDVKTVQNAKSKPAIHTWVNILEIIKNNCAKYKKIAVEVYRVEAEIEEFDMEQQEAGATALTGPQNTKNNIEVDVAKKTQVEKAAKTTLTTNTEALKTETTNKFKKQIRWNQRQPPTSPRTLMWRLTRRPKLRRLPRRRCTPSPDLPPTRRPSRSRSPMSSRT
jgi:hypothetical protein